ncbi:MAG: GlsB/YeaQ/YmgE family stress response membrane protein [Gemmataceae bacterium]|nr:GlsB/YeaQ/YmgE family stress response membrane protein [Gemmataceae bacterium]
MFDIIGWLVAGLVIGAIARLMMPGKQGMGILATMGLGIAGALVGGAISYFVWGMDAEPMSMVAWPGYVFAVLGSIFILAIAGANSYREYT